MDDVQSIQKRMEQINKIMEQQSQFNQENPEMGNILFDQYVSMLAEQGHIDWMIHQMDGVEQLAIGADNLHHELFHVNLQNEVLHVKHQELEKQIFQERKRVYDLENVLQDTNDEMYSKNIEVEKLKAENQELKQTLDMEEQPDPLKEITVDEALKKFVNGEEIFAKHPDGSESLIEDVDELASSIHEGEQFAVERENEQESALPKYDKKDHPMEM
ncbi:hypothetical protein [Virgibacillus ihumii]|uniref:hypothetical protein n=1 Tax=Virgibacillus ihumii TaxID=2686091 RepID=UPI00157D0DBA|nr:hypothetical protein [Virgibacillus ihumii]